MTIRTMETDTEPTAGQPFRDCVHRFREAGDSDHRPDPIAQIFTWIAPASALKELKAAALVPSKPP
jgi:hypothetical protein